MPYSVYKHASRCTVNIGSTIARFVKREISFGDLRKECTQHAVTAWNEVTRPPVTEQHKRALLHLNNGIASYADKLYADAANEFEKAITAEPRYGRAHYHFGCAQYKLGNTEEALKSWEFVCRIDPQSEAADKARKRIERARIKTERKAPVPQAS